MALSIISFNEYWFYQIIQQQMGIFQPKWKQDCGLQ